jgi:hypothetical protein
MSYKLREDETLGEGVRRTVCEEIQSAIEASKSEHKGDASPVHETRTHLKKGRAALRLLEGEVPRNLFRREDRRLRNVGRLISDIRDAEVRLDTLKQLRQSAGEMRARAETAERLPIPAGAATALKLLS